MKNMYNKMFTAETSVSEDIVENSVVEAETENEVKNEKPKSVFGVVSGCKKLNVRKEPSATADVAIVIDEGIKVKIFEDSSTDEFYKVSVKLSKNDFVYGFCMKKFITVE